LNILSPYLRQVQRQIEGHIGGDDVWCRFVSDRLLLLV